MQRAFLLLASVFACSAAGASTFNISPIRAELSAARRTEALTIMNAEDSPVVVQVHVLKWSQKDGAEELDETRELLATPPVMQIAANSEQIIRVALRREPDADQELTYRVIFEEVPQAAPKDFTGLRVALRLSIPVFIAPLRGHASADVSWQNRWLANGQLEVTAINRGTRHLQITDFETLFPDAAPLRGATAKYVLPGSQVTWTLMPPANALKQAVIIHGHSDQGDFSADAAPSEL